VAVDQEPEGLAFFRGRVFQCQGAVGAMDHAFQFVLGQGAMSQAGKEVRQLLANLPMPGFQLQVAAQVLAGLRLVVRLEVRGGKA